MSKIYYWTGFGMIWLLVAGIALLILSFIYHTVLPKAWQTFIRQAPDPIWQTLDITATYIKYGIFNAKISREAAEAVLEWLPDTEHRYKSFMIGLFTKRLEKINRKQDEQKESRINIQ